MAAILGPKTVLSQRRQEADQGQRRETGGIKSVHEPLEAGAGVFLFPVVCQCCQHARIAALCSLRVPGLTPSPGRRPAQRKDVQHTAKIWSGL